MTASSFLLATSIPPRLRGQLLSDQDSSGLQQRVLRSWLQAGCTPVSLHTTAELTSHPGHRACLQQLDVSVLCVQQCAGEIFPNLRFALQALLDAYPDALLVITNADILFSSSPRLTQALQHLAADQALIGRRTNIPADGSQGMPQRDRYGFDFFAFHVSILPRVLPLIPESLVFGQPWWDLYLPLALLACGMDLRDPGAELFLHPSHLERWSSDSWYRHGQSADLAFRRLLRQNGYHSFSRCWAQQRRRAIRRWHGFTVLRHRLREQRRSLLRHGQLLPVHLSDVSDAINQLVETELQPSNPSSF